MSNHVSSLGYHFVTQSEDAQVHCTTRSGGKRDARPRPPAPAILHFNGKLKRRERIQRKAHPRKLTDDALYSLVASAFALLGRHARPGETFRVCRAAKGARDAADAVKRIIDEINR